MSRTYCADYGDRAYERVHAKLKRESKSKEGSHGNGHPLRTKSSSPEQSIDHAAFRQLSDKAWFKKFPLADIRLRDLTREDGFGNAAMDLLQIGVFRSGSRFFTYKSNGVQQ